MKRLFQTVAKEPLFWFVLGAKLLVGSLATSHVLSDLFTPFVNYFVESHFSDPWRYFADLGRMDAFPYPAGMLYALSIPRLLLGAVLPEGTFTVSMGHLLAMRLPLLAADAAILLTLVRWFPKSTKRILWLYWASPITFFISYWHGQLDVMPTALFLLSVDRMKHRRFTQGAVAYALALSMKSHLVVALPFVLTYLIRECTPKHVTKSAMIGLSTYTALLFPFVMGDAFRRIVFDNPEQHRVLALTVQFDKSTTFLVAPFIVLVLAIRFAAYPKRNWDLFMLFLGIVFSVFVSFSHPAPGYFYWSIPFLVYFVCRSPDVSPLLYSGLSLFYLAFMGANAASFGALTSSWPGPIGSWVNSLEAFPIAASPAASALIFTALEATMAGLVYQMYTFGIKSNSIYRASASPFVIGICGDSGVGKDLVSNLLTGSFGDDQTTAISGDNYHRWQRGDQNWQVYTHLDARANDLYLQYSDIISLAQGKAIKTRVYDHSNGKLSDNNLIQPNRFVILSGLHSFLHSEQRSLFNLKVFLDPDEDLRTHWKIRRDMVERGYTPAKVREALARRKKDRHRYILPQREASDIIVRFAPRNGIPKDLSAPIELSLEIIGLNSFNWMPLGEELSKVKTLKVEQSPFDGTQWQSLKIEGTISSARIAELANQLVPNLEELCPSAGFVGDLNGCLQLTLLMSVSHRLRFGRRQSDFPVSFPTSERKVG